MQRDFQIGILQLYFEVVDGDGSIALHAHVSVDSTRTSKEHDRLVDQVRSQIVQNSRTRSGLFAPCISSHTRAKTIEAAVKLRNSPQHPFLENLPHGEEIAIPPAVLEHAQYSPYFFGERNQLISVRGRDRERLVDYDMLPCLQRLHDNLEV